MERKRRPERGRGRKRKSKPSRGFNISTGLEGIPIWIKKGMSKEAIDFTDSFGEYLAKDVSNSQIRNAYGEVTRLKMNYNHSEALLIKPKLAYAMGRETNSQKKKAYKALYKIISKGIDEVDSGESEEKQKQYFKNLAAFFEATLAYHKKYGGK